MPGRRLSVRPFIATLRKNYTERIFTKIYVSVHKEELIKFGSHTLPDPNPGIFKRIFQVFNIAR